MVIVDCMTKELVLNHAAVECVDQRLADLFFITILRMQKKKSTVLSKELSAAIFQIDTPVEFAGYENGMMRIEVFMRKSKRERTYDHLCIGVDNTEEFISRCTQEGLKPFFVEKEGRRLLFVRDFSDNLFEVIEI